MKYYEESKFPKLIGKTGLYSIIAALLVAVGAVTWLAGNKKSNSNIKSKENISSSSEITQSSNDFSSSFEFESEEITGEQSEVQKNEVAKEVKDAPYSSETSETAKPKKDEKKEKRSFILPVEGTVSKEYSSTALQYSATYGDMRLHTGIDIICKDESDIKSVSKGTVIAVEDTADYGKTVSVDYGDKITVKYCGIKTSNVKPNDKIDTGDIIGTIGVIPCESSEQTHLHLEVTVNNESVSPLAALGLE